MTAQYFGEKLRRQRERVGVSLQLIADRTKITRFLLADVERGDCGRWPGGIYARAYIRAYGEAIGLDGEELVADFCEIFPQFARQPSVEPRPPDAVRPGPVSARRGRLAHLRDLLHRVDGRFDLFSGIERTK